MDREEQLEKQFQEYQNLAKSKKDVDVASLMINAIKSQNQNLVSSKQKKWAYLVSLALPPFGLLFALKFYLGEEDDARHMGNICILITAISIIYFWILAKMIFSGAGVDIQQIQQIKPQDIEQLLQ